MECFLFLFQFDVERRDQDTRVSICCTTKPGLLLSTVNTLEALGLEIHKCVISSFNDFSLQASCSEVSKLYYCMFGLIANLAELHCLTVILLKTKLLSFKGYN